MKKYLDEEEAKILQLHKNKKLVISEDQKEVIPKATKSAKKAIKKNTVSYIKYQK